MVLGGGGGGRQALEFDLGGQYAAITHLAGEKSLKDDAKVQGRRVDELEEVTGN